MAGDAELDRLKAAQDLAFQRKQDAWQAQDQAWKRRSNAREASEKAFQAKQSMYSTQQTAWEYYQQVRSGNDPRIDQLNSLQEAAYQNMKSAFDEASTAHDQRNGARASEKAAEGHRYKAESQGYVTERRRLVEENKSARARHDTTKPAFQQAKERFAECRRVHDQAKAEHERAQATFKQAKANFDQASTAFGQRLEAVKADSKRRNDDKLALAEKAGVPYQYRDNVYITRQSDGTVSIYFGGAGKPNGPGHGHYVLDANGGLTYKRDSFDSHGAQNFTDSQRDYSEVVGHEVAMSGEFGFRCRFRGYDAYVESNTNRENREKIDIYYGPNGPFGPGHHHAVAYRESPHHFVYDEYRS